jgi:hypothetical protein
MSIGKAFKGAPVLAPVQAHENEAKGLLRKGAGVNGFLPVSHKKREGQSGSSPKQPCVASSHGYCLI